MEKRKEKVGNQESENGELKRKRRKKLKAKKKTVEMEKKDRKEDQKERLVVGCENNGTYKPGI